MKTTSKSRNHVLGELLQQAITDIESQGFSRREVAIATYGLALLLLKRTGTLKDVVRPTKPKGPLSGYRLPKIIR